MISAEMGEKMWGKPANTVFGPLFVEMDSTSARIASFTAPCVPGFSGNTTFSDVTHPSARSYTYDRDADGTLDPAYDSDVSVTNIAQVGQNIQAI